MPPVAELLVIDVEDACLKLMPGTVRYFALSYVWGDVFGTTQATRLNLQELITAGIVTAENQKLKLPATICDSLRLVRALEGRYLWVDLLCIVQDDPDNKNAQIAAMGSIYANAYCTIMAATGSNANGGLPGIRRGSLPRALTQTVLGFPDCPMLLQFPFCGKRASLWWTRGWTFQEALLSKRAFVFIDGHVAWLCRKARWEEDVISEADGVPLTPLGSDYQNLNTKPWPHLTLWAQLISSYNRRKLTYESDAIVAFSGVQSVLERSFLGGFCYGLPEVFFDVAILWQPMNPLKRRSGGGLPSWSWVGWRGIIDPSSFYAGHEYLHLPGEGEPGYEEDTEPQATSWRIRPLVEWFQVNPNTGEKRAISNDHHKWRERGQRSPQLPDGWRCHRYNASSKVYRQHELAGETRFAYPVPLSMGSVNLAHPGRWPPYLALDTECAFFVVGDQIPPQSHRTCLFVSLLDMQGTWTGAMRLPVAATGDAPIGVDCETISISAGFANNSADESHFLDEWLLPERPKQGGVYESFNVMWISRDGDWVARCALGRVEKGAWRRGRRKKCSVQLR